MGTKYTIEVEDKPFELLSEDGFTSEKLYRVKGFNSLVFDWNGLNMLTPYTEPDMEQVRKEAYNKCMGEAEMLAYKLYSPKIDEAYQRGLSDGKNQDAKDFADMYDSGYGEGLKDAWEAARKIAYSLKSTIIADIFDTPYASQIFPEYSASEAIEKIRAYEKEQEERIDPDKSKVEALANDIGIHKLFALVKEIRGE